jgi:hypothetical protein
MNPRSSTDKHPLLPSARLVLKFNKPVSRPQQGKRYGQRRYYGDRIPRLDPYFAKLGYRAVDKTIEKHNFFGFDAVITQRFYSGYLPVGWIMAGDKH